MNKMVAKSSLIVLIICMLMTGCQSNKAKAKEIAMGRYLEEKLEIGSEKGDYYFYVNKDGKNAVVLEKEKRGFICYEESEDGSWQEAEKDLSKALDSSILGGLFGVEKEEGTDAYYIVGEEQKKEVPTVMKWQDGKLTEVPVDWKENKLVTKYIGISGQQLFIEGYNDFTVRQYDLTTGKMVRNIGDDLETFTVVGDKLYAPSTSSAGMIKCFDINSGKEMTPINAIRLPYDNRLISACDHKGFYLVNEEGVYYFAKDETVGEKLMDGNLYSYSAPSVKIMEVKALQNGIYMSFLKDKMYYPVRYVYHPEVPTIPENQISVFSLEDCETLKNAAQVYKERHPDACVSFQVITPEYSPKDVETERQAIEELNTRILAKEAPDVIILDGLPVQSYMNKDVLEDLSDLYVKVKANGTYNDHFMEAYKQSDKLYALPLRFNLCLASGDQKLLKDGFSLEQLADYQKAHPEEKVLAGTPPEKLLQMTATLWQDRLFDEKGKINTDEMTVYLEAIKTLAPLEPEKIECYNGSDDFIYFRANKVVQKKAMAMIDMADSANSVQVMIHGGKSLEDGMVAEKLEGSGNFACLQQVAGISSQSKQKEAVKELLEIALAKETQKTGWNGLPVELENAKVDLEGSEVCHGGKRDFLRREMGFTYHYYDEKDEFIFVPVEKWYLKETDKFVDQLDKTQPIMPVDQKVLEIMEQETEDYFKGNIDVKTAANYIKEKVDLYVSEQGK